MGWPAHLPIVGGGGASNIIGGSSGTGFYPCSYIGAHPLLSPFIAIERESHLSPYLE